MSCGSGPERNWRHNSLRDAIHEYAVEAGFNPRKEVRFLLPGRDSRPADVLIPHFAGGRDAALDVTVVNPCQVATVVGAAETPGHAIIFAQSESAKWLWRFFEEGWPHWAPAYTLPRAGSPKWHGDAERRLLTFMSDNNHSPGQVSPMPQCPLPRERAVACCHPPLGSPWLCMHAHPLCGPWQVPRSGPGGSMQ